MWIFYICAAAAGFFVSLLIKEKTMSDEHQTLKQGIEEQENGQKEKAESEPSTLF